MKKLINVPDYLVSVGVKIANKKNLFFITALLLLIGFNAACNDEGIIVLDDYIEIEKDTIDYSNIA